MNTESGAAAKSGAAAAPAAPSQRAAKKPPPRPPALKLTAVASTTDGFGAARFSLVRDLADGRRDDSAFRLRDAVGKVCPHPAGAPFRLCPPGQTIAGEFWAHFPKPSAWSAAPLAAEYAAARDREVEVEVRLRPYLAGGRRGVALDLVDLTLVKTGTSGAAKKM